ncbi:hypothetical protein RB195_017639 [Necator americanus]|uniref:Uncharacterized protein n=1 Tax=Necator americanus TaxID=51031 RepID=A0ABR1C756_NECAM
MRLALRAQQTSANSQLLCATQMTDLGANGGHFCRNGAGKSIQTEKVPFAPFPLLLGEALWNCVITKFFWCNIGIGGSSSGNHSNGFLVKLPSSPNA